MLNKIIAMITGAILIAGIGSAGTITQTNNMVFKGKVSVSNDFSVAGTNWVPYAITNYPGDGYCLYASVTTNSTNFYWGLASAWFRVFTNPSAGTITIDPLNGSDQEVYPTVNCTIQMATEIASTNLGINVSLLISTTNTVTMSTNNLVLASGFTITNSGSTRVILLLDPHTNVWKAFSINL